MKYLKPIILWCSLCMAMQALSAQSVQQPRVITDRNLEKFENFYAILNAFYVDTLDNPQLIESAIINILSELDPHSSYSSAEEMKEMNDSLEGSFSGIGVEFDVLRDTLMVVNTIPGGPAEKVGVTANDRIVKIDGEDVIGISRARVPKLLRGERNTKVTIEVIRGGVATPLMFVITRDNIPIYTVDAAYRINDNTGYIKVNRFANTTMTEFTQAFRKLGKVDALILDLRGNGGGLLDQAVRMSEFFLHQGALITFVEGMRVPSSKYLSRRNGEFMDGKLVVLIDASSASGSEIVAGAVQDWDRGVIVGRQSFGKGLVQRQVMLDDGSAVRITTARYHTPSGRVIQRPFEPGKTEEYYIDHLMRAYDKDYADSVNVDAPQFRTLRSGRMVSGGGGITPDIYVPLDTTRNYSYFNKLTRAGLINEFTNTFIDANRKTLDKSYPDFETFKNDFVVTDAMLADLVEFGRTRGVEFNDAEDSLDGADTIIKALIARKLWDTEAYFRIINAFDDNDINAALELLDNPGRFNAILQGTE